MTRTPSPNGKRTLGATLAALVCGGALLLLAPPFRFPLALTLGADVILCAYALVLMRTLRLRLFAPMMIFLGGGILYTMPMVVHLMVGWELLHTRDIDPATLSKALWLSTGALYASVAGFHIGYVRPARPLGRAWREWNPAAVRLAAGALIVASLAASLAFFQMVGGVGAFQQTDYIGRYLVKQGLGPLEAAMVNGFIIGGVMLYQNQIVREGASLRPGSALKRGALLGLLFLLMGVWLNVMQARTSFVQLLFAVLVVREASGRQLKLQYLVPFALAAFVVGTYVSLERGGGTWGMLASQPEFLSPANSDFGAPAVTLAEILRHVPKPIGYEMGGTYLNVFGVLIPLSLWPGRPLGAAEWYVVTFYPRVAELGGAFAFSPTAEAYLNFGTLGVLGVFALFGVVLARLERTFSVAGAVPPAFTVMYALMAPWLFTFFRLDAASFLKGFGLLFAIPLLVIYYFSRFLVLSVGSRRSAAPPARKPAVA